MPLKDLILVLYPEFSVLLALVIAVLLSTTKIKRDIIWIICSLLLLSGFFYIIKFQLNLKEPIYVFGGMLLVDELSVLFKLLVLFVSVLIILGSLKYSEGFVHKNEFIIILLAAILGILFLVGANDLITLFVSLETLGLSSVMLAGYSKYDVRSNEASVKYLLNSAAASSIFLFGLSILYGLCHSTHFYEIKYKLFQMSSNGTLNHGIIAVILILIIGGVAFKLASAPFHMWAPDVYDGSPTPVTAFLSVASKAAGFVIALRLIFYLFDFALCVWQPLVIIISVLSILIGNFVALSEVINRASIKRFMAYSSIAQIGYVLIGLALAKQSTVSASIFYLIIYSFMNLGAFLCIIAFGNETNSDSISDYSGLIKKNPMLALAFSLCLFNLAGLPVPPAGFIAKFILFKASFEAGLIGVVLGVIALISTILSIYYYSYIAKLMIADEPSAAIQNVTLPSHALGKSRTLNFSIAVSVCILFIIVFFSNPLLELSYDTTKSVTLQRPESTVKSDL